MERGGTIKKVEMVLYHCGFALSMSLVRYLTARVVSHDVDFHRLHGWGFRDTLTLFLYVWKPLAQ